MAGRKSDVFYQPPGSDEWHQVESAVVREKVRTARERARALLAEADAHLAPDRGLNPTEQFERDMARAIGAWDRYLEIEKLRLQRMAGNAIDWLAQRGRRK